MRWWWNEDGRGQCDGLYEGDFIGHCLYKLHHDLQCDDVGELVKLEKYAISNAIIDHLLFVCLLMFSCCTDNL